MFTKEKYCAVCGCLFSLPLIRDPEHPDPNEDSMLQYSDPYDSRVLPKELTLWLAEFRVVGRWRGIHSNLQNNSSTPDFFTSPRALWQYGYTLDPNVPTSEGSMEGIPVYESSDEKNGMLFPIHQACLDLVDRICQFRYEHSKTQASAPKTLQDFCDVLSRRRSDNLNDFWRIQKDQYYANCGGIEWDHEYYGAKQFWADEWNSMPGWELLCADPAANKIPNLESYILSEIPEQTKGSEALTNQEIAYGTGWLYPEELDAIKAQAKGPIDWAKGIRILNETANKISARKGDDPQEEESLESAPIGLKNRWRIWKILEQMEMPTS